MHFVKSSRNEAWPKHTILRLTASASFFGMGGEDAPVTCDRFHGLAQ
jgi:hypothetical protein